MNELYNFYVQQHELIKACFLALRSIILSQDSNVTNVYKYGDSFFCYKSKLCCYLWFNKKRKLPCIAFVEGNRFNEHFLMQENPSRIKIMLIDPTIDLPITTIDYILQKALYLYRNGEIKIPEK
jgi:hypothetical protein